MGFRYRSSVTGRWVREKFARRHKRTTQRERVDAQDSFGLPPAVPVDAPIEDQPPADFDG